MIINYSKRLYHISLILLIIVYIVGLVGLNSEYRDQFASLTPITLIFSAILLLVNHRDWNRYFVIYIMAICILGYLVELTGIETGVVFGHYTYGETLGYKLYGVPLVIGLNWFLLIYSSGMVANLFKYGIFVKSLIGATMMVVIDLSLEPVAVSLGFWTWENNTIPKQNYIAWFLISFFMHIYFQKLSLKKFNRIAVGLFIIQYIFFLILSYAL